MTRDEVPKNWHSLSAAQVARVLETDSEKGLSDSQVAIRKKQFGPNKLPEEKHLSSLMIFLGQFKSPLIYILIAAGIITIILKDYTDAVIIFSTVFLNSIIGYLQEHKTSKALRELKRIVRQEATVLREGGPRVIDSSGLVVGDIVMLNRGDKVPADGRVVDCLGLKANEMVLTGEWLPAEKKEGILPSETPLADRDNLVYMGTVVEEGRGKMVVIETGTATEIGRITTMVREAEKEKTPYQKKLEHFSKFMGVTVVLIASAIFVDGLVMGIEFERIFTTTVAVAVSSVPEGLPIAITIILVIGMERILKKKGLVKKLISAETLGSTTVICIDKTGTLTEGKMRVEDVLTPSQILRGEEPRPDLKFLALRIAALNTGAFIENRNEPKEKWIIRGTPTERALVEALYKDDFRKILNETRSEENGVKIDEILFNPVNKFSAVLYEEGQKEYCLYIYGAPEKILEFSNFFMDDNQTRELTSNDLVKLRAEVEKAAEKGLRIIATAYKKVDQKISENILPKAENEFNNLILAGFITIADPVRKDAREMVELCREMGIRPIIVTGDHRLTAKAVAERVGFNNLNSGAILEGKEIDGMNDDELKSIFGRVQVYARVEPKHKLRLVRSWQEMGEVVAMTGDGVNDAPALRQADIGIALGSGTEVAKEASDLILLNDSFSVIVAAVEEGRAILDNIRKVVTFLFSDIFTEIIMIGASVVFSLPLPVLAGQILWVNLIEDSFPSFALSFEPKEGDLRKRKPPDKNMPLLTKEMKVLIFIISIFTDLILLAMFLWLLRYSGYGISHIRSIIFVGLTIDTFFHFLSCRSLRKNIWQMNPFSNIMVIFAWAFGLVMLLIAIYIPFFQKILKTEPLNIFDWQLILVFGILNLILVEMAKWFFIANRRFDISNPRFAIRKSKFKE